MSNKVCVALFPLPENAVGAPTDEPDDQLIKEARLRGPTEDWMLLVADGPEAVEGRAAAWRDRPRPYGMDGSAIAAPGTTSPACFVDLVLYPADPPIPFDDPTILQIFRDFQAWYWPMLGRRETMCETLWYDGVRAAGAILALRADSEQEADDLAASNPWRRLAPGKLLHCPEGVFHLGIAPPGPGTQRTSMFVCGQPSSIAEPGTASPE